MTETPAPTTHVYKTVGDCEIKADVYQSRGHGSGSTPAIIHMHGGALIGGSRGGVSRARQLPLWLDAGYTVISIDYRLAPETKLPGIIEDVQDAFRWVADSGPGLFGADPARIAAVGSSAGGYLALMSGCCVTPRPKAIVSFYGYGDIVADWYSKPDPHYCREPAVSEEASGRHVKGPVISETYKGRGKGKFYLYCRQNGLWPLEVGGRDPGEDLSFFVPYCPARNIAPDYPPTMLLHGDRDTDVPCEQSVLMARALSEHGITHELIIAEGFGHGFDRKMEDHVAGPVFKKMLAFLDAHMI